MVVIETSFGCENPSTNYKSLVSGRIAMMQTSFVDVGWFLLDGLTRS